MGITKGQQHGPARLSVTPATTCIKTEIEKSSDGRAATVKVLIVGFTAGGGIDTSNCVRCSGAR